MPNSYLIRKNEKQEKDNLFMLEVLKDIQETKRPKEARETRALYIDGQFRKTIKEVKPNDN